jgi:beta-lactamase class A
MAPARIALAILATISVARAESAVQRLLEDKLLFGRIKALDAELGGVLGVATIDLASGRIFVYNGEAAFPAASVIKIPIMMEMFRQISAGRINPDRQVTLTPADSVGGSGNLQNALKQGPVTISVQELIRNMIENSDNIAANRCIAMAGMENINGLLSGLGFRQTKLRRVMMDAAAAERGDENTSSPLETARLLEMLYHGRAIDSDASRRMVEIMKRVKGDLRAAIPAGVEVASKPGDLDGVRCEAGIVYLRERPFVLSVFSTFLDQDANPVPQVAKIAFEYFQQLARSNEYGHEVRQVAR